MTALMAVLGLVPPIAVAGVPAPIVLQNIAVILAGVILGPWRGPRWRCSPASWRSACRCSAAAAAAWACSPARRPASSSAGSRPR
ncbi:hypothetical protein [Micrococcus luteus]|uniref:hypothetical protein n=1 Tax=Micrococcus luteus TaxID=1270 RepID=UPI0024B23307|nr:hypothetical protein [Micrococcus luteus]